MKTEKRSFIFLYALPLLLLLSTILVFLGATRGLGKDWGYFIGFVFYWSFWGVFIPARVLRKKGGWRQVLCQEKPFLSRQTIDAVLLFLIITRVSVWMYWDEFSTASIHLILVAVPVAIINGFCEEALWRGLYVKVFPKSWLKGLLLPAIGFALWHIAPQLINTSETGIFPFVLSTLFLGLAYGWIAYRTGSSRWTAISHSLSGIIAVGGPIARIVANLFF